MGDGLIDPLGKKMPGLTKPLIVAVHGDTWNMAHELFLVADIRVAADNTNFGQDENTHGRFPGGGSTVRFPREAGWANAMRYILTGDHWTAQEAYRMGTVQEVASSASSALDKAIVIANKIAASGPLFVILRKNMVQECFALPTLMSDSTVSVGRIGKRPRCGLLFVPFSSA
jgi:enoyl-CoA hydratase/carnithine racemase